MNEYKLTDYLTSINWSKKKLMDTENMGEKISSFYY